MIESTFASSRLSRLLADPNWLEQLRNVDSPQEAIELVRVTEMELVDG